MQNLYLGSSEYYEASKIFHWIFEASLHSWYIFPEWPKYWLIPSVRAETAEYYNVCNNSFILLCKRSASIIFIFYGSLDWTSFELSLICDEFSKFAGRPPFRCGFLHWKGIIYWLFLIYYFLNYTSMFSSLIRDKLRSRLNGNTTKNSHRKFARYLINSSSFFSFSSFSTTEEHEVWKYKQKSLFGNNQSIKV